jgi:hypothetical protein
MTTSLNHQTKGDRTMKTIRRQRPLKRANMRSTDFILLSGMFVAVLIGATAFAQAQQTTGTPGAADATTTIEDNYLPPAPPRFGGNIGLDAKDSKPYWPPRVVPPKGAPNILLIMTDDQGYGISSTFGGVIPTPVLDRVAKAGLRYTQFHSTSLCSPTRAALITRRNHHSVGFGVIAEQPPAIQDMTPLLAGRARASAKS